MLKIEIWSDINCPFCYIGKRHLEEALSRFQLPVEIEWRSFELDPLSIPPKGADQTDLLAQKYGKDRSWALQMNANMTKMASQVGLEFHMDIVVPANSFNAHRLIHLAKSHHMQDAMKERLLSAKFKEGKDIDDKSSLQQLALEVGLPIKEVVMVLDGEKYSEDVRADEEMAGALGIRGVPFFVFNKKVALSGAQPVKVFEEVLEQMDKLNSEN